MITSTKSTHERAQFKHTVARLKYSSFILSIIQAVLTWGNNPSIGYARHTSPCFSWTRCQATPNVFSTISIHVYHRCQFPLTIPQSDLEISIWSNIILEKVCFSKIPNMNFHGCYRLGSRLRTTLAWGKCLFSCTTDSWLIARQAGMVWCVRA